MHDLRPLQAVSAAVVALTLLATPGLVMPAEAKVPTTPTVEYDKGNYARNMTLIFYAIPDPGGARTVVISCDGGATLSEPYPFASRILVSLDLPGCEGYGLKRVDVQVDADASPIFWGQVTPGISPRMTIGMPDPPITGHAFTLAPAYPADYSLPAGSICRYEFRWGNDKSLANDYDETFGALGFDAKQVNGRCPAWTFTLPWVPYRQFELYVDAGIPDENGEVGFGNGAHVRFDAAEDGTGRRIASSNLPIAQVLPSTYTPIVGQSITYTRYLIGGATAGNNNVWTAWQGAGDHPNMWHQDGGATFTIRPMEAGNITVGWQRMSGPLFYAMYDPPVRHRDVHRPTTTAPKQHVGSGAVGASVPATITWDGSDRGWGIAKYQLERSLDGGAWKRILSAKVKSASQSLAPGHAYRYRVRAIDRYGNVGRWQYGPSFRTRVAGDGSSAIRYSPAWTPVNDATARGGSLHESTVAGSVARFTFTGLDVAWIAERGPGHGKAKVYVDGRLARTVDLAAAADAPARIVFRKHWSTRASHTIRVVVAGTAGRPVVDVDGFIVLR